MRSILTGLFLFILLSACEEIPEPLVDMIETTLEAENVDEVAEASESNSSAIEEVEIVAPPEGLYEPVLSLPGGKDASKQQIVINKIREITLKKRTKTLDLFEYSASQNHKWLF